MSSKLTITANDDYNLYKEAFDDEKVIYFQLYDCKELRVCTNHYHGTDEQQVTVAIPERIWEKAVSGWLEFCAQNNQQDTGTGLEGAVISHEKESD
jgi:hypothetical protein|tara:strand:+ start:269 stop:556 length:288 start_codon:yes stop_codon:yes gene_type:complete